MYTAKLSWLSSFPLAKHTEVHRETVAYIPQWRCSHCSPIGQSPQLWFLNNSKYHKHFQNNGPFSHPPKGGGIWSKSSTFWNTSFWESSRPFDKGATVQAPAVKWKSTTNPKHELRVFSKHIGGSNTCDLNSFKPPSLHLYCSVCFYWRLWNTKLLVHSPEESL